VQWELGKLLLNVGHTHLTLLIGLAVFIGAAGAWLTQKIRIPQIIGFVAIGFLLGPVLHILSLEAVDALEPFTLFALGLIGYLIGGELKREIFVKFGRQVIYILLFEGLTAFVLVGILSFGVMICFASWQTALAVAVVFAAICSATDPASTVSVLWEYKARGPLTVMLTAIVALDDALALFLYAIGVSVAGVITGHQEKGLFSAMAGSFYHIAGAISVGLIAGIVLTYILKRIHDTGRALALTVGTVLVVVGAAGHLEVDVIIATMVAGVTVVNLEPRRTAANFELLHRFSTPIYILFFVLTGARLNVTSVNLMICLLTAAYVLGSIVGKTSGAYLGAVYSKTVKTVRNYLGFCLYPQGGIAVGLLIMASRRFDPEISSIMLLVVIMGAFILQIIGPLGVKYGGHKAGELGLNITEDDLTRTHRVRDVMDATVPTISAGTPLRQVIQIVSTTDSAFYPVVDERNRLIGTITMDGIRNTFATQELHDWLVALDIAEPIVGKVVADMPLAEALEAARKLDVDFLPVVTTENGDEHLGILDIRRVHRRLSAEVLARQKEADEKYHLLPA